MKLLLSFIVAFGIIRLIISSFRTKRENEYLETEEATRTLQINGSEFVDRLDSLDYFKYTERGLIEALKSKMTSNYNIAQTLITINKNESPYHPIDYKYFNCDGETLFEEEGIAHYLDFLQQAFKIRDLNLDFENEISSVDGDNWDHRITINGKEYVAYSGSMNTIVSWGIATLNFVRMLNDQLDTQGSQERVYPISGGHEGELIFLTEEQFDFISKACNSHKESCPLKLEEWQRWNKIPNNVE